MKGEEAREGERNRFEEKREKGSEQEPGQRKGEEKEGRTVSGKEERRMKQKKRSEVGRENGTR